MSGLNVTEEHLARKLAWQLRGGKSAVSARDGTFTMTGDIGRGQAR